MTGRRDSSTRRDRNAMDAALLNDIINRDLAEDDEPTGAVVDVHFFIARFNSERVESDRDAVLALLADYPAEAGGYTECDDAADELGYAS